MVLSIRFNALLELGGFLPGTPAVNQLTECSPVTAHILIHVNLHARPPVSLKVHADRLRGIRQSPRCHKPKSLQSPLALKSGDPKVMLRHYGLSY
jgi:hypothetical protein